MAEVAALAAFDFERGSGGEAAEEAGAVRPSQKTAALIFQATTSTSGDSEAVFVCVGGCWLQPPAPDLTAAPRAQRHSSVGVPAG